jgi:hypothetical protein
MKALLSAGLGAALLAATAAAAQTVPCSLVDAARVKAMFPSTQLPIAADTPGMLHPRDAPGLPVPLRIDQCTSAMTAAGAIGFRLGLITVPRELTAAEWAAVGKALDHAEPMLSPAPQCARAQEPTQRGGTLHSVSCGHTRGRHRVEISFEHEQAARLPSTDAVRSLVEAAFARL